MTVSAKSINAINEEMQEIPIEQKRIGELPVELNQLLSAARALRAAHDFDRDPADFQRVLHKVRD
ncbi:MAG: hypothetical protein O3B21_04965 [Proteobacteria bacterium]|nr:hypothetical protein [Pseudomonadota bacterium]MDA1355312.1 hypothetical protein [Pseudomonadota bacterium]